MSVPSLRRVRLGELLALVGVALLVAAALVPWFSVASATVCRAVVARGSQDLSPQACGYLTGTGGLPGAATLQGATLRVGTVGHPWLELLAVAAILLVLVVATALRAGPGRPTTAAVVSLVVAVPACAVVLVATLVRVLLLRPTTDVLVPLEPPTRVVGNDVGLAAGPWLALAGVAVGLVGAWLALVDERRGRPDGDVPVPVRPAPIAAPPAPQGRATGD